MNLTLGVAAHVDAGKTTLCEQLLRRAGVIRACGRVDHGDAFMDDDPMERARGITIFTEQATLAWPVSGDEPLLVTLMDTPGHVDFSGEMERALSVLDAALLVVSCAEGVQSHTVTLFRLLQKRKIPTIIFLNKTDREGADVSRVTAQMRRLLSGDCVLMAGDVREALAERDEVLLEQHLDETATKADYLSGARRAFAACALYPVLAGSALNDMGEFAKPYFQFSAACAGCAETTYIKLLSQLFGDRMYIGNAAGCSSAISGGAPILPYCKDCQGHGPAWEHSLFEDNAEFAYGFFHAQDSIRKELLIRLEAIKAAGIAVEAVEAYENGWKKTETSRTVTDALIAALEQAEQTEDVKYILENKEYLAKKSVWAVGGDGWAYDIGYGGIDHVMAQNRDVNLMVLDTEVYSNTGGQSSKSTPTSATAKFAAGGKRVAKKDLGAMLMQYGYVYVAQVAMGADQAQTLKALREAESYDGPSIVICYCPCLEQHIKAGMGTSQDEMKKAVECGYWHLYRYDPRRIAEGKNPFQLDSKEPDTSKVMDFLMGENRFASLKNNFPDKADALYAKEVEDVKARYAKYKKLAES